MGRPEVFHARVKVTAEKQVLVFRQEMSLSASSIVHLVQIFVVQKLLVQGLEQPV